MHPNPSALSRDPLPLWKRSLDITCCLLALPFLAVGAFFAFLIMAFAAPGPIFFRQERVGYKGRRFLLYKFRTMHVSAAVSPHQAHFRSLMTSNVPMQKLDARGDSRLVPGGWFLRATGFDELPQIINVLKGEMSLVGPRPCIPYEYENYSEWQLGRLNSVPGLTGLWQVSGKNRTTFDEMIRLDIEYGEKLSFGSDIGIMARTLPALWTQLADTRQARRAVAAPASVAATESPNAAVSPAAGISPSYAYRSQNTLTGANPDHISPGAWPAHKPVLAFNTMANARPVSLGDRHGPHG
jgi:lipopolysaccharide/colanic/teichoic acid biosynthesis glycosyltransferase